MQVKHILSRDHVLELMTEWNSNPDVGEKCRLGEESNNPATTCQQDEPGEAQASSTSNNSNTEFGPEIETENGGATNPPHQQNSSLQLGQYLQHQIQSGISIAKKRRIGQVLGAFHPGTGK